MRHYVGFSQIRSQISNKSPTNIMNLTQNGTTGYLNTMGRVIMYTLSFEYHIQGILW